MLEKHFLNELQIKTFNVQYIQIVTVDVCSSTVLLVFFRAMIKSVLSSRATPSIPR